MKAVVLLFGFLFTFSWAYQSQDVSGVEREEILTENEVSPSKRSNELKKEEDTLPVTNKSKEEEKASKKCGCGCCHGCGCHGCGCCQDDCDCCHHTCGDCCSCNGCDCVDCDSCHMAGCECCHGCCGCCGDCTAHCCEPPQCCVCHGCGCDCHGCGCGCKRTTESSKSKRKTRSLTMNAIPTFHNFFRTRRGLIPFSGVPYSSQLPLTYASPYKAPLSGTVLNNMFPTDSDHIPPPYVSAMARKRQIIPHGLWGWDEFGRMGHGMGGQEYNYGDMDDCMFAPAFGYGHMLRYPLW